MRKNNSSGGSIGRAVWNGGHLRRTTRSIAEELERRRLLSAAVVPASPDLPAQTAPLAPRPGHTFYVDGRGATGGSQASAITPYTINDLLLNVAPFDTNYPSCCDGGGARRAINLLTNGITQNQIAPALNVSSPAVGDGGVSDASGPANAVFDPKESWYASYHLGTPAGYVGSSSGYDIREIDVISGHESYGTQMTDEILVQYANSSDWVSLSKGNNFTFNQDPKGKALGPGAAQMAIVSPNAWVIASDVVNIKFVAVNDGTWFRELVVTGTPSGSLSELAATPHMLGATFNATSQFVDVSFASNAQDLNQNPVYYNVERAPTSKGPWTKVGVVYGPDELVTAVNFTDQTNLAGATSYYRVQALSPAGGGRLIQSDNVAGPVSTPPSANVETHYYNQAYWEGAVTQSTGVFAVNFTWGLPGSPSPGVIRNSSNSSVFTGKLRTQAAGIYTFISNTQDDGYLYVAGALVSEDPGIHPPRDAGQTTDMTGAPLGTVHPVSLAANTQYDFVFLQSQSDGTGAAHLEWITPGMPAGATPQLITALTPISDSPSAPTGLTMLPTPEAEAGSAIEFSFIANNNAVVHYILQRSADGGSTWVTVNQIDPGGNLMQPDPNNLDPYTHLPVDDLPGTEAPMKIQDASPIQGVTCLYRVAALNYDGAGTGMAVAATLGQAPGAVNPPGAEGHYFNAELIDPNNDGAAHVNDAYAVAVNGIPAEYQSISQNAFRGQDSQGGTWLYGGAIDFDWSQRTFSGGILPDPLLSPDPSLYPDVQRIHNTDFTTVFTGQIVPAISGVYTLIGNSDDDGFLWVDDRLVSADPGVHEQRDASASRPGDTLVPISLVAGQHYNFVFEQQQRGGATGAHLKWIEPPVVPAASNHHIVAASNCANTNAAMVTLAPDDTKPDGYFDGYTIYITGGAGAGQKGVIEQYVASSNQAILHVTNGCNALQWGVVPDETSTYQIAWEQGIPLAGAGANPQDPGGGLVQRMDVPHKENFDSNSGIVADAGINFSDPATSAAGDTTITAIDPANGVTLTWTDQGVSELWFEVQRSGDNGTTWQTIGRTPMILGTSFTDPTAANAYGNVATYSYRVRGVNYDGAGPWAAVVNTARLEAPAPPAITGTIPGLPGTIGLTFAGQSSLGGGLELQGADLTAAGAGAPVWKDVTPSPLSASTFDYLVTGLIAGRTYQLRVRNVATYNQPASAYSDPVTVFPTDAAPDGIGTPGNLPEGYTNPASISGQFASSGDIKLNGAVLSGNGYPAAPTPTSPPVASYASDVQTPTAAPDATVIPNPATPAALATNSISFVPDMRHGVPAGSYYIEYAWLDGNGGQTLPSAETRVDTQSATVSSGGNSGPLQGEPGPSQTGDLVVTIPAAQGGRSANVYIASASGKERLAGTVAPGGTLMISHDGFGGTANFAASSTAATVPAADTTGLQPGLYYVRYSWTGSLQGETAASAAQVVTIPAGTVGGISVSIPAAPAGAGAANLYIGTTAGTERLFGSAAGGSTVTIRSLPPTTAASAPAANTIGLPPGTYVVEYAWIGNYASDNVEGQPSPPQTIALSTLGDINLSLPAAPLGTSSANVYMGTSGGVVRLVGSAAGGTTFAIRAATNGRLPNPINPTAPLTSSEIPDPHALPQGTYYLKYTWTSNGFETAASPEQAIVAADAGGDDIFVTVPALPAGATAANVYLSSISGQEVLVGSATPLQNLTLWWLPNPVTGKIAPSYASNQQYHTPPNALQFVPNQNATQGSAFQGGQDVGDGFRTSFDFQFTGDNSSDGVAFVIQPLGRSVVGGGPVGYDGIEHSVAIYFDSAYPNQTGLGVNGSRMPGIDLTSSGVDFRYNPLDVYNATITYDGSAHLLTETISDLTKKAVGINAVFQHVYNIDIAGTIGMNNAYVGFTGANTGTRGEKDILNWSFSGAQFRRFTVNGFNDSTGGHTITLTLDPNGRDIDWTVSGDGVPYSLPAEDVRGLSLSDSGAPDRILLDYGWSGANDPLPLALHFNQGTFNLVGLSGADPLAGHTLDIGRGKLFINYSGASPLALVQRYLANGYHGATNGLGNGNPWTGAGGAIVSAAAAADPDNFGIGYADSADGTGVNTQSNTIELMYTLRGDANLDGSVTLADLLMLTRHIGGAGAWDMGDFNYDGTVDLADLQGLTRRFGRSVSSPLVKVTVVRKTVPRAAQG